MERLRGKSFSFLGRSGSGKGTQFDMLQKKLEAAGIEVLRSTSGDMFRRLAEAGTIAGQRVQGILREGGLIPAWLAEFNWERKLVDELKDNNGAIIFDGSPRRLEEAQKLDEVLPWLGREMLTPIHIEVSREESFNRLKLRARADDTDEVINARLGWFDEDVVPCLDYYKEQNRLITINGLGDVDEIFSRLLDAISGH